MYSAPSPYRSRMSVWRRRTAWIEELLVLWSLCQLHWVDVEVLCTSLCPVCSQRSSSTQKWTFPKWSQYGKKKQKKLCVACYTTSQATTETCDPLPFEREEWRTCTSRGVRRCLLQCNSIISRFMTLTILFHSILTTFSTLAVPSVTGASLITVIILLTALNIPAEAASLLFALEWFL